MNTQGRSGLGVVVLFLAFAAVTAGLIGTLLLFPGKPLESLWRFNSEARAAFESMGRLSSVLLYLVGAVAAGAAVGIRRRRKWGWWLAVLLFTVNLGGDVVSFAVRGVALRGAVGVLISALFLLYLIRPKVRSQFST